MYNLICDFLTAIYHSYDKSQHIDSYQQTLEVVLLHIVHIPKYFYLHILLVDLLMLLYFLQ